MKFIFVLLLSFSLTIFIGAFREFVIADVPVVSVTAQTPKSQPLSVNEQVQQGKELYESGQFTEAVKVLQQASKAFKASGDFMGEAIALINLSQAWQQLGELSAAKSAITSSLELIERGQPTPELFKIKAQALNAQATLEFAQGKSETAISIWDEASKLYSQSNDLVGKHRILINQAQALQSMGLYSQALNILQQVNQNLQFLPNHLKAAALHSLGNSWRLMGNLEQSRQVLEQGLKQAKQLTSQQETSNILLSLGNTARSQQDTIAALDFYAQAAKISTSPTTVVKAKVNQFNFLVAIEKNAEALELWSEIQNLLAPLPPNRAAIEVRINLAQSLKILNDKKQQAINNWQESRRKGAIARLQLPNIEAIAQMLATAVQQAKNLGDARTESFALGQLGAIYEQNQQFSEAMRLTQQALIKAQSVNASEITYRWQWQRGRILKAQGDVKAAIVAYTEAVNILKSLRSDLVAINSDVQFSFRESVEPIYRQLVALLLQTNSSSKPSQENLVQARNVIESLQLAELDDFFHEACIQAQPVQVDNVDKTAAVIYPIILNDSLEVILSLPGQPLHHYRTVLPRQEFERIINSFKQSLSPIASSKERARLSTQIYNWLIQPAKTYLDPSGIKTLVFVLDGSLRNLPMAALYDGRQYLIEQYSIAISPGLQLLAAQPLAQTKLQVLKAGLSEARQGFPALPAVESELKQIAAATSGKVLLNEDLTSANVQAQLINAPVPIIHLATHGQFSSKARETFFLTWDGKINVKELNQILRSRDSQSTTLELLVLSACQTATGDSRATLGLAGVAIRSGARSTLASLWSVKDESTAILMTQFYRELSQSGITKAEALRRAQLTLLRDRRFQQPLYWAPFVLVGNWA